MPDSQGALDILDVLHLLSGKLATWQGIVSLGAAFLHLVVLSGRVFNYSRCSGSSGEALQALVHTARVDALFTAESPADGPDSGDF